MTVPADATDSSTITELAQTVEDLKETVETQAKQISKLEKIVDQQSERIEQLEAQSENELLTGCHRKRGGEEKRFEIGDCA